LASQGYIRRFAWVHSFIQVFDKKWDMEADSMSLVYIMPKLYLVRTKKNAPCNSSMTRQKTNALLALSYDTKVLSRKS